VLKAVDRLILKELLPPFLFAFFAFVILIVGAALLKPLLAFLIKYDLGALDFFRLLLLALPEWVVYTFPMAMLTGSLLAVGRLSGDSEVTALRTAGISLYRITWPIMFFALVLSLITFTVSELVAPYTNNQFDLYKQRIIEEKAGTMHETKVSLAFYQSGYLAYQLLAEELMGDSLSNLHLFHFQQNTGKCDWYLSAANARWTGESWSFHYGALYNFLAGGAVTTTTFTQWDVPEFALSPSTIAERSKDPSELSASELSRLIRYQKEAGLSESYIRRFDVDYFFKFSIPFSPLFFVLIGVPLAILPQRTSTSMGMGFSLLIVLGYFFLFTVASQMGRGSIVPPLLAAWIPNLALLVTGLILLRVRNR
jgi:lipopolysaccharide export system permease protein